MTSGDGRFAAVIGHADDPAMLDACIRHHLAIGVANILVIARNGAASLAAAAGDRQTDERVRIGHPGAPSALVGELRQWADPDWVLFADADEFWLPRSNALRETAGLDEADVFVVERYNAPVLRQADGSHRVPDVADLAGQPLVAAREGLDESGLSGGVRVPWIMARGAPRLMARMAVVEQVGPHSPALQGRRPEDLLIAHVPFTDEERFRRKVGGLRRELAGEESRSGKRQAWYQLHWARLPDEELGPEFRRQAFQASVVPVLRRQGVLATAPEIYPRLPQGTEALAGDTLHTMLERTLMDEMQPMPLPNPDPDETLYAAPRYGLRPEECYFYHSMDVPGHGEVTGQWDLRGQEGEYLGGVPLAGKTVLEVGPASGYLTFWMERQGARVTSYDLDEHAAWDIVPFGGIDPAPVQTRAHAIRLINNAWWLLRERFGATARMVHGTVYDLHRLRQTYDVVTLNSVLLHLRDPFMAIARAAQRCHGTLVITDVARIAAVPPGVAALQDEPMMYFLPRASNGGPADTWWILSLGLVLEIVKILGFKDVKVTHHRHQLIGAEEFLFYTVRATR